MRVGSSEPFWKVTRNTSTESTPGRRVNPAWVPETETTWAVVVAGAAAAAAATSVAMAAHLVWTERKRRTSLGSRASPAVVGELGAPPASYRRAPPQG